MATTTAAITITSSDLLTDALALSTVATLTTAGDVVGLTSTSGLGRKTTTSTSRYTLFDGSEYASAAHKVYLKNVSTDPTQYLAVDINEERVGKLYAGDWAFFPWDANADTNDIKITPSVSTSITLEYMLFIG
tara:strand:- start:2195 stop:2593 length:399 start_codon:yes stop_codon:yes gene_type:complete